MTKMVLAALALGIVSGVFLLPSSVVNYIDNLISAGLIVVLLLVGIGVGRQKGLFQQMRRMGPRVLLVPLMIALGSLFGSILAGILVLKLPWYQAGAAGAGFGWYSFVGVELSKHSAYLGTLAFITNVSREMISLVTIPFIAKKVGKLETTAPAGTGAMTVALPLISRSTDANITIIAFISGTALALAVPVVVPLIMGLGG